MNVEILYDYSYLLLIYYASNYTCKLPKSSNADKQRDFLCLTDNVALFVVTNNRFASLYS